MKKINIIKKDIISELSNSPYWKTKSVISRTRTNVHYKIKFSNMILDIVIDINGKGIDFFISDVSEMPYTRKMLKWILNVIRLEREFKQWDSN